MNPLWENKCKRAASQQFVMAQNNEHGELVATLNSPIGVGGKLVWVNSNL